MPSSGGPGGQWNVAALLDRRPAAPPKNKRPRGARFESRFEYLVQWEDRDPTTGEPYEPTWEPTTYITPAAIESYYIDKYEAAGAQRPDNDDAAAAAAAAAAAGADDVPAPAPKPAAQEKAIKAAAGVPAKAVKALVPVPTIAVKTATAVPTKADDEAVPRRPKTARADEDAPKRQRSARTVHPSTADPEKEKQGAKDDAAAAAPAPRKRGTSPTPDKENTKRIRVADMLLT